MKIPFFSVYVPSYNHSATITDTLNSLFNQTFTDFEVIVRDDGSKDNTLDFVKKFKDKRLTIKNNVKNLGYSGNLNQGLLDCHSNNIFILAGDDLIDKNTLRWYYQAFKKNPQAGAITRPYYWFDTDYHTPVRLKKTTKGKGNLVVTTTSPQSDIMLMLSTLDQCSGLCFKRNLTKLKFCEEPWIAHSYPWLDIFKNHPVIFLKKYSLAVRIGQSATRTNIYQKSPMISWKNMIDSIFFEAKFKKLKHKIISDFIGTNYIGLVQIRNFGNLSSFFREAKYLILFRPINLLNPKFYFFFFLCFLPPKILIKLSDNVKTKVYSKTIPKNIIIHL